MSKRILDSFDKYHKLSKAREEAWSKAFAAPSTAESKRLGKIAEKIDKAIYSHMIKSGKLADAEATKIKKKRKRKSVKAHKGIQGI